LLFLFSIGLCTVSARPLLQAAAVEGNDAAVADSVHLSAARNESSPRQIKRLILLCHPYAWELQFARDPRRAKTYRWGGFNAADLGAMERRVSSRWLREVRKLGPNDFLIINYFGGGFRDKDLQKGPIAPLLRAAREHLGDRYLLLFGTAPKDEWGRRIQHLMREKGYTYDASAVATESWGQ